MPDEKERVDTSSGNISEDNDSGKRLDSRYWSQGKKNDAEGRIGKGDPVNPIV